MSESGSFVFVTVDLFPSVGTVFSYVAFVRLSVSNMYAGCPSFCHSSCPYCCHSYLQCHKDYRQTHRSMSVQHAVLKRLLVVSVQPMSCLVLKPVDLK